MSHSNLPCSGLSSLVLASSAWRCDVMKMMHSLRRTAYWLFHAVCYIVRSQYVGIRLHPQDWIAPSSADHGWLVPAVTNRSGLTVDLSQSLLRPTGADSRLICWYSLSAMANRNGLAVDLSDLHCIFDTGMEHLPLA